MHKRGVRVAVHAAKMHELREGLDSKMLALAK